MYIYTPRTDFPVELSPATSDLFDDILFEDILCEQLHDPNQSFFPDTWDFKGTPQGTLQGTLQGTFKVREPR